MSEQPAEYVTPATAQARAAAQLSALSDILALALRQASALSPEAVDALAGVFTSAFPAASSVRWRLTTLQADMDGAALLASERAGKERQP